MKLANQICRIDSDVNLDSVDGSSPVILPVRLFDRPPSDSDNNEVRFPKHSGSVPEIGLYPKSIDRTGPQLHTASGKVSKLLCATVTESGRQFPTDSGKAPEKRFVDNRILFNKERLPTQSGTARE